MVLRAYPGIPVSGRVSKIALLGEDLSLKHRTGEQEKRVPLDLSVYDVVIELDGENESDLIQGMSGEVTISTAERVQAVVIPRACLVHKNGRSWAYVRRGQGWQEREVSILFEDDQVAAVGSGVIEGEQVAILVE